MTTAEPAGPQRSFEDLVVPCMPLLRRLVGLRVQNSHDAEDVVQQTLVLAFRNIGRFRFESSVATWLCCIAINVIRGRLRRPESWRSVTIDPHTMELMGLHDHRPSAQVLLERKEMTERLRGAIARLPETYRTVVELRDLHGLSIRETADSLLLSTPAVKSRHFRAKSLLFDLMREPKHDIIRREIRAS